MGGKHAKESSIEKDFSWKAQVGSGSYSRVWHAVHVKTKTDVAIKREKGVFDDLIDCKRILREIRFLQTFSHPNLVKLLDVRSSPGPSYNILYLVLEYAPTDLKKLIRSVKSLEASVIRKIIYQLLKGIKYLHSAGILHRDIKPANILLTSSGEVKICDFGLSRGGILTSTLPVKCKNVKKQTSKKMKSSSETHVIQSKQETNSVNPLLRSLEFVTIKKQLTSYVVTRWYRAPEIILTESDYGPGIDIWSVGCIFAELLSLLEESNPEDRMPLFPGNSCYPFSPTKDERAHAGISNLATDQLNIILTVLGTPTEEDCNFIKDKEKVRVLLEGPNRERVNFADFFPKADKNAIDLLNKMIVFNPYKRAKVSECLDHPYFKSVRDIKSEIVAKETVDFEFEKEGYLQEVRLRELINEDLEKFKKKKEKFNK